MDLLTQSETSILLFNSLILIIILIVTLKPKNTRFKEKLLDDNARQAEIIKQLINDNQRNLDDKLARSQTHLFESISTDREKQLASLEELKLTLEKRFANSEKALSDNIQSFKVDMVERFEQLKRNTSQSLLSGHEQLTNTVNNFGEKISNSMQSHQTSRKFNLH